MSIHHTSWRAVTGLRMTVPDVVVLLVAAFIFALWLWIQWQMRRAVREHARSSALPLPDAPDAEFAALADELEAGAYAAYEADVQRRRNVKRLDALAAECPMRQRSESPVAAPGEPWRLRPAVGAHDAGLVEPGVPNDNPLGEQR